MFALTPSLISKANLKPPQFTFFRALKEALTIKAQVLISGKLK